MSIAGMMFAAAGTKLGARVNKKGLKSKGNCIRMVPRIPCV